MYGNRKAMQLESLIKKIRKLIEEFEKLQDNKDEADKIAIKYIELVKACKSLLYKLAYLYASVENEEIRQQVYQNAIELLKECKYVQFTQYDWEVTVKRMRNLYLFNVKHHYAGRFKHD